MIVAATLFAIAAVNGMILASCFLMAKPRPLVLAIIHLVLAATGLVFLGRAVWVDSSILIANLALAAFVLVALSGFVLLSFRVQGVDLYAPLLAAHAMGAVIAFVLLLMAILIS